MRKALLIVFILTLLAVLAGGVWLFTRDTQEPVPSAPVEFPIAGPGTDAQDVRSTMVVAGQSGTIIVNDFLRSADAHEDPINPGYYYLGQAVPPDETRDDAPYHLIYIVETSYFNVVVTAEPIGENRRAAEQKLMSILGIGQESMCNLVYTVSVPNDVNETYTGTNLGFSFCEGAVQLP